MPITARLYACIVFFAAVCAASSVPAADKFNTWSESGATREFYNVRATLKWKNRLGDWRDVTGEAQGEKAFSENRIADNDSARRESWNVTGMVKDWLSGRLPNQGVFLRVISRKGKIVFHSREAADFTLRPSLVVRTADGLEHVLPATQDTTLDRSTHKPLGKSALLNVGAALLKFDLGSLRDAELVSEAFLQLHTTNRQYGTANVGVFHPDPGLREAFTSTAVIPGLAARYPDDRGIEQDPSVVLFAGFETTAWTKKWTIDQDSKHLRAVESNSPLRFKPLYGKALQVVIPEGSTMGLNLLYKFKERTGTEPEEIYFRYYLRLADDWNPTVQGGKFPGIAGTYGRAGWGGRRADGKNGWSMRGLFKRVPGADNPLHGLTPVGTYAYFGNMPGHWGSHWMWTRDNLGLLERNRWYCLEQFVKLNSPDKENGIIRAWVDGKLAFENERVLYRTTEDLKIDRIWMNVYHGGSIPAPVDYHLFIDNVVVAKNYIGPANGRGVTR